MPDMYIDIDVDDFYREMDHLEKCEMYENLVNDGYADSFGKEGFGFHEFPVNIVEWEFQDIIEKIATNRLRLTSEEEETLRKIASKF